MAAYSNSSKYCDLTVQETSHKYETIQTTGDNDQSNLSESDFQHDGGMTAYSSSSAYCDLTVQETSHKYETVQSTAGNDQSNLSESDFQHDGGMTAYSSSSAYCDLTVQETSHKYETVQSTAGNDQNFLSESNFQLNVGMAVYSPSNEYCYLTAQEMSQYYDKIEYLRDNGRCFLSERVSGRRCLTKRQRLAMLLVVILFSGVAFVVPLSVVVSSKTYDIGLCSPNPCIHGICTDGMETYHCKCFPGFNGTNCDQERLAFQNFWTGPVITDTKTTYVNYSLVFGQGTLSDSRACAEEFIDNQFLAVRVNERTGACEGLNWDWGSDPQYVEGYAYLRKTKTVDSYQPSFQITKLFQWLLPGTFGVGGRVDIYISIRRDMAWKEFEIMMLDKTDKGFGIYDSDEEVIMVYAQIQNENGLASVHFKIWNAGWSNKLYLRKTSVADGNAHKFTFVPHADVMQIFIDDTKVVEYVHPTDPATAKEIIFDPYAIPSISLHNITFLGILKKD